MSERERLSSPDNPLVKRLIALRERRARKGSDWVRIDGARELLRALDAELPLRALLICSPRSTIACASASATRVCARRSPGHRSG